MNNALADLHRQQGQVDAMIDQVEARISVPNAGAWGWIALVMLIALAVIVIA